MKINVDSTVFVDDDLMTDKLIARVRAADKRDYKRKQHARARREDNKPSRKAKRPADNA
jgi:Zn-finger nucleic acid-binding protein